MRVEVAGRAANETASQFRTSIEAKASMTRGADRPVVYCCRRQNALHLGSRALR